MRAMVATVALSGVLAAGLAAMAVLPATAQDDGADETTPTTGAAPEDLVARLVDIERGLPALPPSAVVVDPDETFGQLEGDFIGALTELELVTDQARQLFIDADEADAPYARGTKRPPLSPLSLQADKKRGKAPASPSSSPLAPPPPRRSVLPELSTSSTAAVSSPSEEDGASLLLALAGSDA